MTKSIRRLTIAAIVALSWAPTLAIQAQAIATTPATASSGYGSFNSVSCPSAGNCAAAGAFGPGYRYQAVVISDTNGKWGRAKQVSGLSSLPGGLPFSSELMAVSCPTAGNCGAGGYYFEEGSLQRLLVVDEKNGVWGNAQAIDMSHLRGGTPIELSQISFLSCWAPGDCTAAGSYTTPHRIQVFVVGERDGTWGPAENLPGSASVTFDSNRSGIESLSCVSPGDCAVGGSYDGPQPGVLEAFVATYANGAWSRLQEVPGTGVLNAGFAPTNSMSCTAGGNCTAVGSYESIKSENYIEHPFITSRTHGTWSPIKTVPGLTTLPTGGAESARLDLVWCASAASCTAVGDYVDADGTPHWFSVTERNGTWANAVKMHTGARSPVVITTMSCSSISSCSAGGYFYFPRSVRLGAFVISRKNGVWGNAEQVPGLNKVNQYGYAKVTSVSCVTADYCAGAGLTSPKFQWGYPFITTETAGTWGNATIPGLP